MRKMYKILLAILIVGSISFKVSAQKVWSLHSESSNTIITDKAVARLSFPKEFKLFDLDIAPLRQELFSITDNQAKHSTVISLPNADGNLEEFEVFEASNFEPALQAKFPEIRAFSGRGITDKYSTLKLSISPQGIQTMVFRTEKEDEFIEAYSKDHTVYAVFKSRREKGKLPWTCSTNDKKIAADLNAVIPGANGTNGTTSSAGQLKVMRLAQSVTAEYSNYFGATSAAQVGLVLAAINATLTRCNGCYEKDLAVHLDLIAGTTAVIYYDAATDPYSPAATGAAGAWNAQLMNTLHNVLGDAAFDIGHLFGASGGGGNAGCIGCVCSNDMTTQGGSPINYKGSGFTSPADNIPQGDNFDIDYVVHEVGHQMGANHTFSMSLEGTGVNKEVGSGITIMGYAGITNQDVAPHSIDIYHEASIQQIQANLATKSCPVTTTITANNATPVVAPVSNYTIPISTPFALTGSATDANAGDVLTYCWEQNDNSTTSGNASVASPTKLTGPNWLSFSPTISPTRLCPKLSTILAGLFITPVLPGGDAIANIEALSSVARTLNFRLTVRDNSPYVSSGAVKVGQTAFTDMAVTVSAASGPFAVTAPNTAVSWAGGSTQTITWSVNNTTAAPVSCANVKISLSTDGGQTFPTVLAASTPNDGTEDLVIPNTPTTTARIKIEAVGNIFFDISNANFTITVPANDFAFGASAPTTVSCPASPNPTVTIPTTVTGTFVTPIVLTATAGVPAGTTVTFAPNPLTPGSSTVATLNNANTLGAGTYTITVTGTAGTTVHTTTITFIISAGTPPVITTQPVSQSVCAPATATFSVVSSTPGVSYKWQSATAAAPTVFTDIPGATSATYTTGATTGLNGTVYHVIVYTQCSTVTSSNATLTVNTAAAITTQPTNQQACTGNTATFTVAATGTGVTYQWQSSPTAGGPYTNVSTGTGGTTASYTTAALTVGTDRFYHVIVTTTTCPGTVTSNEVTLTTSVTTAINTQPTAQTVCAPASATFTVAAVGTNLTYQWQVSTAAVPAYTNVTTGTGGTTATYNTGATTGAMSGNSYHVVVTGTCNTVTSSNVTLTVNTAPVITTAPSAVTICSGNPASFTVAATGTNLTYQWQSATALAGPYSNIPGATSATYAIASTTAAMSGTYYQVVITGTCTPAVTSTPVLLTVNSPVVIGTQPVDASICYTVTGPNNTSFAVAATGTALTYQWQVSTDGGANYTNVANAAPYSGATTNTLNLTGVALTMNGNKYRVLVSGTCTPAGTLSNVVTLTVLNPVVINADPVAVKTCAGATATFTVSASGSALTYKWQFSKDGVNWGFVTNTAPFSGANTPTLTITNVTSALNGYQYRAEVIGTPCGDKFTAAALLTVNDNPSVVLTVASPSSINPSTPAVLYTTVSPVANYTYQYKRNGVVAAGLTASSVPLNVDLLGTYQVTVTNTATGCSSTSNSVTVTDLASDRLFIYPNPNKGVFQARYYNAGATTTSRTLTVYDNKGAKIYSKTYPTTAIYERMDVNISGYSSGTYFVEVRGADGKLLATGKVKKD